MKKIIIIMFFLILSGCNVEYNLTYKDNIYTESANIFSMDNEYCGNNLCSEYINNFYNSNISININDDEEELAVGMNLDKYKLYNKELLSNGMNLNYQYNEESDLNNSRLIKTLFNRINFSDNGIVMSDINNIFVNYPYLENIKISFSTDKYVANTNSDSFEDGIYYWNINKDNYSDKNIDIRYDKKKNEDSTLVKDGFVTWSGIKYILGILIIIILILIVFIYEKVKKSNK